MVLRDKCAVLRHWCGLAQSPAAPAALSQNAAEIQQGLNLSGSGAAAEDDAAHTSAAAWHQDGFAAEGWAPGSTADLQNGRCRNVLICQHVFKPASMFSCFGHTLIDSSTEQLLLFA